MTVLASRAREFGFVDAAICEDLRPSEFSDAFLTAEAKGWFGDMHYLSRSREQRLDVGAYLPWARVALVALYPYAAKRETRGPVKIADYACLSDDYHDMMRTKAEHLARTLFPPRARLHVCVDSAPVAERELAVRAGLGFLGKNGLLISSKYGSKVLLCLVFSDSSAVSSATREPLWNMCGTCRACLDSCPTQAFDSAFRLNPQKCISYWTVESKAENIPADIVAKQSPWVFGCDTCQDVCPWNRFAVAPPDGVDAGRSELTEETVSRSRGDASVFFRLRKSSPLSRLSFQKWRRNTAYLKAEDVEKSMAP
jgi:epoxyqueuosine reductase